MPIAGLLLAAGQGSRMGMPKALIMGRDGVPWVVSAARVLLQAGCDPVHVMVGASREEVIPLLADLPVRPVCVNDWQEGVSASLRAGLISLPEGPDAAVIHLVDLPDVTEPVVRRVMKVATPASVARAVFDGQRGHPVLLGRQHWSAVIAQAQGDAGANLYLATQDVRPVECGDIATGRDVDHPPPAPGKSPAFPDE